MKILYVSIISSMMCNSTIRNWPTWLPLLFRRNIQLLKIAAWYYQLTATVPPGFVVLKGRPYMGCSLVYAHKYIVCSIISTTLATTTKYGQSLLGWGFFRQISEGVVLFSTIFMFKQSCSSAVLYQAQGFNNAAHVSRCRKDSKTYIRHLI